jgi:hypothetical protein
VQIAFGPLSWVLEQAGRDTPVLVLSAMGAQSTGKSYLLNHLANTFFDVAGGRCTDGT